MMHLFLSLLFIFISIKQKVRAHPFKQYATFKGHCNLLSELSCHMAQVPALSTKQKDGNTFNKERCEEIFILLIQTCAFIYSCLLGDNSAFFRYNIQFWTTVVLLPVRVNIELVSSELSHILNSTIPSGEPIQINAESAGILSKIESYFFLLTPSIPNCSWFLRTFLRVFLRGHLM